MSLISNDSAIKRFTFDWLIRFAELHPLKIKEYFNIEQRKQWVTVNHNELRPDDYPSKYAAISPLFTTLINRYMPYIFYYIMDDLEIRKGKIIIYTYPNYENLTLPSHRKLKIIVSEICQFTNLQPGMITWFKDNKVIFIGEQLMTDYDNVNILTFDELKYLLKFCTFNKDFRLRCKLVEPTSFSELCPLITNFELFSLHIKNLKYGENTATILRQQRVISKEFKLGAMDISEKAILDLCDYFLELPVFPTLLWLNFMQRKPEPLAEAIVEKFQCGGVEFEYIEQPAAGVPFDTFKIQLCEKSGKFKFLVFLNLNQTTPL